MKTGVGTLLEPAVDWSWKSRGFAKLRAGSKLVRIKGWVRSSAPFDSGSRAWRIRQPRFRRPQKRGKVLARIAVTVVDRSLPVPHDRLRQGPAQEGKASSSGGASSATRLLVCDEVRYILFDPHVVDLSPWSFPAAA